METPQQVEKRLQEALAYIYQRSAMTTLPVETPPERAMPVDRLMEGMKGYRGMISDFVCEFTRHAARHFGHPEPEILGCVAQAAIDVALRIQPVDLEGVIVGTPTQEQIDSMRARGIDLLDPLEPWVCPPACSWCAFMKSVHL